LQKWRKRLIALTSARWRRHLLIGLAGLALLVLAGLFIAGRSGVQLRTDWWLPTALLLAGLVLAWYQLGSGRQSTIRSLLQLAGGLVLVSAGIALFIGRQDSPAQLLASMAAGLAVVAGVAVVLAPWWLRLWRGLVEERSARARESERADIAAHLHDSVLQTLTVIRARAENPDLVRRLARSQERELRAWLYEDTAAPAVSLAAGLRLMVAEIEDEYGVEVGCVIVGDCQPTAVSEALLGSTREALLNAVRHGAPPFSVYLEARAELIEVFVRDHGIGFDLAVVPPDRLGVRVSIIGRLARQGGHATVRQAPGGGTEVHLVVKSLNRGNHG
jgi:signal transduction histidine kinase